MFSFVQLKVPYACVEILSKSCRSLMTRRDDWLEGIGLRNGQERAMKIFVGIERKQK